MSPFRQLSSLIANTLQQKSFSGPVVTLVRHTQSMGNYAGSIVGWTDSKLSIKGREQANKLYAAFQPHVGSFTTIYSSDLSRCIDTCNLALGFPKKVVIDKNLRELHFGDDEGRHFDSLPASEKQVINSLEYKAPNGETWVQVADRVHRFYTGLSLGNHLIFTHGGLMCTQTFPLGHENIVPNGSVVCLHLDGQTRKPRDLLWDWKFPSEEEI